MGTVRRCTYRLELNPISQELRWRCGFKNSGSGRSQSPQRFCHLGPKDDHDINAAEGIVYDALDAYGQEMVCQAKPGGTFRS
jgi:hypothetical protein